MELKKATADGFYKIGDIVRTKATRGEAILPIGRTTWLNGINDGLFPKPVKLLGINVWRKSDIHDLLDRIASDTLDASNDP